jgi:selenocysteine lyase/cysteine desulfurase
MRLSEARHYTGRNGTFKAEELIIRAAGQTLQIIPLNARGNEARCSIAVPNTRDDIAELIQILSELLEEVV